MASGRHQDRGCVATGIDDFSIKAFGGIVMCCWTASLQSGKRVLKCRYQERGGEITFSGHRERCREEQEIAGSQNFHCKAMRPGVVLWRFEKGIPLSPIRLSTRPADGGVIGQLLRHFALRLV